MNHARKDKYFGFFPLEVLDKFKDLSEEEYWEAICVFFKWIQSGEKKAGVKKSFEKQFTARERENLLVIADFLQTKQEFRDAVEKHDIVEDSINKFIEEGCCCGSL